MHVLRHHHVPDDYKPIAPTHLIKNDQKRIPRPRRPQKRQPPITTESNEMQLPSPIAALKVFRHRSKSTPSHPSQTQRRMGHPQGPRLNFGVNYWSGIILTEAPSIVETTETKRRSMGHPPDPNYADERFSGQAGDPGGDAVWSSGWDVPLSLATPGGHVMIYYPGAGCQTFFLGTPMGTGTTIPICP
jgi:hypothetical protein